MILYREIPEEILEDYKGRIIGWLRSYDDKETLLVTSKSTSKKHISLSKDHGINPIIIKCPKCTKPINDNGLVLGGECHSINVETNHTVLDVDISLANVYSIAMCQTCAVEIYETQAATLKCKTCDTQTAWLESAILENGFEIKSGENYHSMNCIKCEPEQKEFPIIEMVEFIKKKNKE